jgi:hypothetical protein
VLAQGDSMVATCMVEVRAPGRMNEKQQISRGRNEVISHQFRPITVIRNSNRDEVSRSRLFYERLVASITTRLLAERDVCAHLAEVFGRKDIAAAIRNRKRPTFAPWKD